MDFFDTEDYNIVDIQRLIDQEVEENIHLDYKASGSLSQEDRKKIELTKDISAFANSDGGIIVYGVSEKENKPLDFSFIDGNLFTKEWLENIITSIRPRINGIKIFPLRKDGEITKSIYVVKIPRSDNAPHMARDSRYYKRYNFKSVPMEEYEVKDLYSRKAIPDIQIDGCSFYKTKEETDDFFEYKLMASITNTGHTMCDTYKLNFYINNPFFCNFSYKPMENKHSFTFLEDNRIKISSPSKEPIYSGETLDIGGITIHVNKEHEQLFLDNLIVDMILFYQGGNERLAYIPSERRFVENQHEIEELLKSCTKNRCDYFNEIEK